MGLSSRIFLLSFLLSLARPAFAEDFYRPVPFMGSGYSDKHLASNRWKAHFFFAGRDRRGIARTSALYRASLIAKASGQSFIQVVGARAIAGVSMTLGEQNMSVDLTFVGVPSLEYPSQCEEKKEIWKNYCKAFDVDRTIQAAGSALGRTPDEMAQDYADAQAKVASYPPIKG